MGQVPTPVDASVAGQLRSEAAADFIPHLFAEFLSACRPLFFVDIEAVEER